MPTAGTMSETLLVTDDDLDLFPLDELHPAWKFVAARVYEHLEGPLPCPVATQGAHLVTCPPTPLNQQPIQDHKRFCEELDSQLQTAIARSKRRVRKYGQQIVDEFRARYTPPEAKELYEEQQKEKRALEKKWREEENALFAAVDARKAFRAKSNDPTIYRKFYLGPVEIAEIARGLGMENLYVPLSYKPNKPKASEAHGEAAGDPLDNKLTSQPRHQEKGDVDDSSVVGQRQRDPVNCEPDNQQATGRTKRPQTPEKGGYHPESDALDTQGLPDKQQPVAASIPGKRARDEAEDETKPEAKRAKILQNQRGGPKNLAGDDLETKRLELGQQDRPSSAPCQRAVDVPTKDRETDQPMTYPTSGNCTVWCSQGSSTTEAETQYCGSRRRSKTHICLDSDEPCFSQQQSRTGSFNSEYAAFQPMPEIIQPRFPLG